MIVILLKKLNRTRRILNSDIMHINAREIAKVKKEQRGKKKFDGQAHDSRRYITINAFFSAWVPKWRRKKKDKTSINAHNAVKSFWFCLTMYTPLYMYAYIMHFANLQDVYMYIIRYIYTYPCGCVTCFPRVSLFLCSVPHVFRYNVRER